MTKFCIECKYCECNYFHYSRIKKWWIKSWLMHNYYKCCRECTKTPLPNDHYVVTGEYDGIEQSDMLCNVNLCSTERLNDSLCGKSAKHFEQI